jgi:hypothetical protein
VGAGVSLGAAAILPRLARSRCPRKVATAALVLVLGLIATLAGTLATVAAGRLLDASQEAEAPGNLASRPVPEFGARTGLVPVKVVMGATEALRRVRGEWSRRIEAEYTSAAHTHHITLWFIQLAFPRELIDDGLRIVADELDHAKLSADVLLELGGAEPPALNMDRLALPRHHDQLAEDALLATVELFCLGETVAVPLFKELRAECSVPVARAALDRILRDEVRHRAFGWDCLEYLLGSFPEYSARLEAVLPQLFSNILRLYGNVPRDEVTVEPEERLWGLMPRSLYRSILLEVARTEYLPRFAEVGVDAKAAWQVVFGELS